MYKSAYWKAYDKKMVKNNKETKKKVNPNQLLWCSNYIKEINQSTGEGWQFLKGLGKKHCVNGVWKLSKMTRIFKSNI